MVFLSLEQHYSLTIYITKKSGHQKIVKPILTHLLEPEMSCKFHFRVSSLIPS